MAQPHDVTQRRGEAGNTEWVRVNGALVAPRKTVNAEGKLDFDPNDLPDWATRVLHAICAAARVRPLPAACSHDAPVSALAAIRPDHGSRLGHLGSPPPPPATAAFYASLRTHPSDTHSPHHSLCAI